MISSSFRLRRFPTFLRSACANSSRTGLGSKAVSGSSRRPATCGGTAQHGAAAVPRTPEQQYNANKARYQEYRDLCALHHVDRRGGSTGWYQHYKELRALEPPFRRLSREQLHAFWRERFTADELWAMASAIDTLLSEDEGRWEEAA